MLLAGAALIALALWTLAPDADAQDEERGFTVVQDGLAVLYPHPDWKAEFSPSGVTFTNDRAQVVETYYGTIGVDAAVIVATTGSAAGTIDGASSSTTTGAVVSAVIATTGAATSASAPPILNSWPTKILLRSRISLRSWALSDCWRR